MAIQLEMLTKTHLLQYQLKDEIKSLWKRIVTKSIENLNSKSN